MKNIQQVAEKFEDVEQVKKEIKRIQSIKCRLKKQKFREDYETEMTKIVQQEQILKEVREFFEPKKLTVTTMTLEDIKLLDYDETQKAIKSIQSKKCNSQFNEVNLELNVEYQEAVRIEKMLQEHKLTVKPITDKVVRKSTVNELIHQIENQQEDVSKEYLLEQLKSLLNN